jgi:transposase
MVFELSAESGSACGSRASVGHKLGINPETLRNWVEKVEVDGRKRPGTTSDDRKRIAELEREGRELRRANEILRAASAYFT